MFRDSQEEWWYQSKLKNKESTAYGKYMNDRDKLQFLIKDVF